MSSHEVRRCKWPAAQAIFSKRDCHARERAVRVLAGKGEEPEMLVAGSAVEWAMTVGNGVVGRVGCGSRQRAQRAEQALPERVARG